MLTSLWPPHVAVGFDVAPDVFQVFLSSWPLDGLRVFWIVFHLPSLCLRLLPLAWTVGKSLLRHKFLKFVCVFLFLLSLHPAVPGLPESSERSANSDCFPRQQVLVQEMQCSAVLGFGSLFCQQAQKCTWVDLLFFGLVCTFQEFGFIFVCFCLPSVVSLIARTQFVCLVFFSFANVPSHNPEGRPANAVIKTLNTVDILRPTNYLIDPCTCVC